MAYGAHLLAVGAVLAFFDAFGIGANDVANAFATSVNSGVFTLAQAAAVAMIFEFLGAITAGAKVSSTVQKGILSAKLFTGKEGLLQLGMVCALLASATCLQIANMLALPVSTTHAIIGGVMGVGIAAFGVDALTWGFGDKRTVINGIDSLPVDGFAPIALSWIVSPIVSGLMAAAIFMLTKYLVLEDNAVSRRIHPHSFWRAAMVAPFFYGFVASMLVLLLAFKGVSSHANASELYVLANDPKGLGIACGVTGAAVWLLSYLYVSYWQIRVTWNGEDLRWYEWPYFFVLPQRPKRANWVDLDAIAARTTELVVGAKDALKAVNSSVELTRMPTMTSGEPKDTSSSAEDAAVEQTQCDAASKDNSAVVITVAASGPPPVYADARVVKLIPPEIANAMKIAEAAGYVVREMSETELVLREYQHMCNQGTWKHRLLCPFRAVFCHGILGAEGKERTIREHGMDDPSVTAIHNAATKYDPRTERFFAMLQMTTSIIASFAHGSNDVANALGPFSTIYGVFASNGSAAGGWPTPDWMLAFGGLSISLGFATYGYHLMRSLGNNLTFHSPSRGYCMEFGAALTVLIASRIGLPISTTQCITGATIGIGMLSGLHAVNWRRVLPIFLSWVVTVPAVGLFAGLVFAFIAGSPSFRSPQA